MFQEDLRTESLARRKWMRLIFVTDSRGEKMNILDYYMRLTAVDLKEVSCVRSPSHAAPAINMYIALWHSLGLSAKAKMLSNKTRRASGRTYLPYFGRYSKRTKELQHRLFGVR